MPASKDPTEAIRLAAVAFEGVAKGTSCNQSSFKTAKGAFLYIGPGPKGQGFKAMFKLVKSRAQAERMAEKEPERFEVGSTQWVTARFTTEKPLAKSVWSKWLKESYGLAMGSGSSASKKAAKKKAAKKKAAKKKAAKKKVAKRAAKKAARKGS